MWRQVERSEMGLSTRGFLNSGQLNRHYQAHGAEFECASAAEYEEQADTFLSGSLSTSAFQCVRKQGDLVRYDTSTQAYGVLDKNRVIRTFFKPVPCASVPALARKAVAQSGRCHGQATNLLYFQSECQKW